jgi:hypothetical protein
MKCLQSSIWAFFEPLSSADRRQKSRLASPRRASPSSLFVCFFFSEHLPEGAVWAEVYRAEDVGLLRVQ